MEMLELSESGPGQQQFPSAMLFLPRPNLSHYNTGRDTEFISFATFLEPQTKNGFKLLDNIRRTRKIMPENI
jgi:hypothetical protein